MTMIIMVILSAMVIVADSAFMVIAVKDGMLALADGDLSLSSGVSHDTSEIGPLAQAMDQTRVNLREIVQNLSDVSAHINSFAGELNTQAQNTSSNANETLTAMTPISDVMEQVSGNVQKIAFASDEASKVAGTGEQANPFTGFRLLCGCFNHRQKGGRFFVWLGY